MTAGGTNTGAGAGIIEASLPLSSLVSTNNTDSSFPISNPSPVQQEKRCLWKGCNCSITEATWNNLYEHIQTTHVAPQLAATGYSCLWEGCRVFNKKSSSRSWLERHVLSTHSGARPYKCIFTGCGLSFSSQRMLERHINGHIATNGAQDKSASANKRSDAAALAKAALRRKRRLRKNVAAIIKEGEGQPAADYFDKRTMEVIKHWLTCSVDQFAMNIHDCTFRGEIIAGRVIAKAERQVLVRWYPRFIFLDEWLPESKFSPLKLVPLRQIPRDKIHLLYPSLFPPARQEKAQRKRKRPSNHVSSESRSGSSTPTHSEGSSSLSTLPPSPSSEQELSPVVEADNGFKFTGRCTRLSSATSSLSMASSLSSTPSVEQGANKSSNKKKNSSRPTSSSGTSSRNIEATDSKRVKLEVGRKEVNCQFTKFTGGQSPSTANDNEDKITPMEPSHWALEVLYEDLGML